MINQRKSDILLINPPSGFLIDQKVFLPLGIAYIAAHAREQEHNVRLLDLAGIDDYAEACVDAIKSDNFDAVGITATSPQFFYANKIREVIKREKSGLKVILGGSHASMFAALRARLLNKFRQQGLSGSSLEERLHLEDPNFAALEKFDAIASGEEKSLSLALDSSEKWIDAGVTSDVNSLPLPARDLFDVKSYLFDPNGSPKFKVNGKATGSLISQRGCPFTCEFCCGRDSEMYHQVRLPNGALRVSSPERILAELDYMNKEFGLESFMFYDDEFNLSPQRTKELCRVLKQRNYRFRGFVKSDLLVKNPEVAAAMKEAGFNEVLTGIESGSERILSRHLHKHTSPELNYRAAMICLENGIDFKALTMLGHTSETPRDVMDTRNWILKVGNEFNNRVGPGHFTFDLTVFQPYAGCPIWDRARKNTYSHSDQFQWVYHSRKDGNIVDPQYGGIYFNKIDFATEHGFYKGIPGTYKAFIRTDHISPEQFVGLRDAIEWEVRDRLKMHQLAEEAPAEKQFEHSMGQGRATAKD